MFHDLALPFTTFGQLRLVLDIAAPQNTKNIYVENAALAHATKGVFSPDNGLAISRK
jgi:hypothetical protein